MVQQNRYKKNNDPSLAAATLGADAQRLLCDLETFAPLRDPVRAGFLSGCVWTDFIRLHEVGRCDGGADNRLEGVGLTRCIQCLRHSPLSLIFRTGKDETKGTVVATTSCA